MNQMSIYTSTYTSPTLPTIYVGKRNIFGSSRVGSEHLSMAMDYVELISPSTPTVANYIAENEIGDKRYELSNHLGNVLNVIADRKLAVEGTGGGAGTIDYFTAEVVSYTDYYPYGMTMPGKKLKQGAAHDGTASNYVDAHGSDAEYRYGFNGMEADDEIKGNGNSYDFGARMYDSRVGRWLTIDPLAAKYPSITPYNFVNNTPVMAVDPDGRLIIFVNGKVSYNWERHDPSYWSGKFITRVKSAFGDQNALYRDGDISSNAWDRRQAGYRQAKSDWKYLLNTLEKNDEGKIIEPIQMVSHSRGSTYALGYAKRIRKLREANSELFAEDGGKVQSHIMLAPHQSGSSAMDVDESSTITVSITHDYDPASDGGATGDVLNIETDTDQYATEFIDNHTIDGFHNETEVAAKQLKHNIKYNSGTDNIEYKVKKAAKEQGDKLYDRKTKTYKSS